MTQKLRNLAIALAVVLGLSTATAVPAGAINVFKGCSGTSSAEVCKAKDDSIATPVQTIISILFYVIGIVAVIMIIVGAIRYTISNGDASQIKSAKDTVLYSVIGLIVAMLAYAIVNFVTGKF
mgnify:CR=1 FL=1